MSNSFLHLPITVCQLKGKPVQNKENVSRSKWFYPGFIALLAIIVYAPSLNNGFVSFDDEGYITQNPVIHDISLHGLKTMFSSFVMANYHPFVVLCDALLYRLFGLTPTPYHLFSLLLHLLNIFLVFEWIYLLTGKRIGVAALVAILFAIQPMHVETVCWASDLKDLLYTFFFLASLIYYTRYINSARYKFLFTSALLFIGALFSKSAAVTLPVVFLLIDYYYDRKITLKTIAEKIPLFLLSLVFGLINIYSQRSAGAFTDISSYNILDRLCIPAYNLVYYLYSLFLPSHFAVIHPLPEKVNGQLPWQYYASPVVLPGIAAAIIWAAVKYPAYRKSLVFCSLFFLVTVSLVIQIRPIGQSVVSERYTYLPYVGLCLLLAVFYFDYITKNSKAKFTVNTFLGIVIIVFSVMTYQRSKAWESSLTLLADEVDKYPDYYKGYEWRGEVEKASGDFTSAINDFARAIELNPKYTDAYNNRGICKDAQKDYKGAFADYTKAVELTPGRAELYNNMGTLKQGLGDYNAAMTYFNKAIELDPNIASAYYNRGINKKYLRDYKGALIDYNKAIELKPDFLEAYDNRAEVRGMLKDYKGALSDYDKAISLNPEVAQEYNNRGEVKRYFNDLLGALADYNKALELDNRFLAAYNNRGIVKYYQSDFSGALSDFDMSLRIQPDANAYNNRGNVRMKLNDFKGAIEDFSNAVTMVPSFSEAYLNRGMSRFNIQDKAGACDDWRTALDLGNAGADQYLRNYCK